MCAVQAWDNVPEVFQGQDGCSDIRGKPHRAEADSLHVLHLPPIKKPRALWLSLPVSLSHSLTANYLQTPCLDLSKKLPLSLSFFDTLPLLGWHASVPHVLQMNSNIQYSKVYSIWVYFRIKAVQVQDFDIYNVISSLVVSLWAKSSRFTLCACAWLFEFIRFPRLALVGSFLIRCLGSCCTC